MARLEAAATPTPDASPATASVGDSLLESRPLIERPRAEINFERTRNGAANREIVRLKRWRFGLSVQSQKAYTRAGLFDAILTWVRRKLRRD